MKVFVMVLAASVMLTEAEAQLPSLGEVFLAVERAAAEAELARNAPFEDSVLTGYLTVVRRAGLARVDLSSACGDSSVIRMSTFARQRRTLWDFGLEDTPVEARNAMIGIWQMTNTVILDELPPERHEALLQPFFEVSTCLRKQAMGQSVERLRRYEIKFGPGSPQLNGLEVLANYGAQWLPRFGPDDDGNPGPLEIVASYAPMYLYYTNKPEAASAVEFGLRVYNFSAAADTTSWVKGLLSPRYWALGVAVLNEREETLAWPWQGNARTGPFINWGEVRVAYIVEGRKRLLVSRNLQLIPLVF